jgi:hypothetical protein
MGTLERTETLAHRIGANGHVSVKTVSGTLRVRGIEGEEARLTVTYRIRSADQVSAERALETGRVIVDRGPSSLSVETPERRLSTGLAWLFGGARVAADVSIDVPWGTRIRYETMSGSIEAVSLVGDQKYRTVSGDIRMWSLGGLIEAGSISGSITLESGGDVRLRANTISGGIRVRARRFHGTTLSTTSGSIAIVGELDPSGDHRAESISGSVDLTPLNGVTAELRAISGSIVSNVEHRLEGGRGYWRSIVGDGRAVFRANSTSGGLRILAAQPGDRVVAATAPAAPAAPAAPSAPGAPAAPAAPAAPPAPQGDGSLIGPAGPAGAAAPPAEEETQPHETGETWNPDESADAAEDVAEDEELAVLQALERGEIGVDEAAERLERARR